MQRRKFSRYVILLGVSGLSLAAQATDFYVSNSGNDSNSGRTPAEAFQSVSRGVSALRNGDSLFFRAGDKWTPSSAVQVTVSGSESDPVVIGAFQLSADGSVSRRVQDGRPVLDGKTNVPSRGSWDGLITVRGTNVKVQDLEIKNSGGLGLVFQDTSNGAAENVKVEWTYRHGLLANKSDAVIVKGVDVSGFGRGSYEFGERPYPTGVSIVSGSGFVVTDSYVHDGWGEGISAFRGSSDIVFENNVVLGVRNVGIYLDASRNAEVRGNIVLGTTDSRFYRSGNFVGAGIALSNEIYQYQGHGGGLSPDFITENIGIYNNLVAGTSAGVTFWGELPGAAFNDIRILHNTFVDNRAQFRSYGFPLTDVAVANNIFLSVSADAEDVNPGNFDSSASYGVEFSANYWSEGRPASNLRSSSDVYSGLTLRRASGWREISEASQISWRDFQPVSANIVGDAANRSFLTRVPSDFNGTPHGSLPDIGALSADSEIQVARRPSSPSSVRLFFQ